MNGPAAQKGRSALTASQIISALPNLKSKELSSIKAAIEQLQPTEAANEEIKLLFDTILTVLECKLSWLRFGGSTAYKDFQTHAPGAVLFIKNTFRQQHKIALMAVMKFLIGLLIHDLKKKFLPVTLGMVCRNLNRLPMVFDDAFPNYRESGLVPMLMKQMEK